MFQCKASIFITKAEPVKFRNRQGFTLIEILTTISVLFIISSFALPSMTNALSSNRQFVQLSTLQSYLHMARADAIIENRPVIMCKSRSLKKCENHSQWSDGWIIFSDKDNNKQLNNEEQIINKHGVLNKAVTILYNSFSGEENYVKFYEAGYSHTNGSFIFCDEAHIDNTKTIIISRTGRIRYEEHPAESVKKKCLPFIKSS